jgi:hypothetical protein
MSDSHGIYNQYVNRMSKKQGNISSDIKIEKKIKMK